MRDIHWFEIKRNSGIAIINKHFIHNLVMCDSKISFCQKSDDQDVQNIAELSAHCNGVLFLFHGTRYDIQLLSFIIYFTQKVILLMRIYF